MKETLRCPRMPEVVAFNTPRHAITTLMDDCEPLAELVGRADADEQIVAVHSEVTNGAFTVEGQPTESLASWLAVLAHRASDEPMPPPPIAGVQP
ncbi:hypothetical protein [Cellulomonas bogoriensis]|uniref:hypothetical protein n=1 Tax=Cellulomonas bogoriensis TaxID=301388 RepID=UPI0018DE4EAB|nr:hypothetical protein [Cellulomonas bogoriensis]